MSNKYAVLGTQSKYLPDGKQLFRIIALKSFLDVQIGEFGGWVESEANLSQDGDCWVYDEAIIMDNAVVSEDAQIYDNAVVSEDAKVFGSAHVYNQAKVYGDAQVSDNVKLRNFVKVYGNSKLSGNFTLKNEFDIFGDTVLTDFPRILITEDLTMVLTDNSIIVGCVCYPIEKWETFSTHQIELITPGAGYLFKRYEDLFKSIIYLPRLNQEEVASLQEQAIKEITPLTPPPIAE